MEALFNNEGTDDFLRISNFSLFVISTVVSFCSFVHKFTTVHATHLPWQSKLIVGLYGIINLGLRIFAMIAYFVPSLGLLDVLRHFQVSWYSAVDKKDFGSAQNIS